MKLLREEKDKLNTCYSQIAEKYNIGKCISEDELCILHVIGVKGYVDNGGFMRAFNEIDDWKIVCNSHRKIMPSKVVDIIENAVDVWLKGCIEKLDALDSEYYKFNNEINKIAFAFCREKELII